jgi:hypothetical protein
VSAIGGGGGGPPPPAARPAPPLRLSCPARPTALGNALRRLPCLPSAVAGLLGGNDEYLEFRRILHEVFPTAAAGILAAAPGPGGDRESARMQAFYAMVERDYFPVYEWEEYAHVCCGIPFVRFGWALEDFHDLDRPVGSLLLLALCQQPYEADYDSRVPLLVACEAHVSKSLLEAIPERGLHPNVLHERLDGTEFAAAAEFADWLWSSTGTAFLDFSDEEELYDADWTIEHVALLTEQWQVANGILERTRALGTWLEGDPPARFAQLLDAALEQDPHVIYLKERTNYVCEITEDGIVPVVQTSPAAPGERAEHDSRSGRTGAADGPVPRRAAA